MAAELVAGATLGVAFQELFTVVTDAINQVRKFNSELEAISKTLRRINPLIDEIEKYSNNLGQRSEETETLRYLLMQGHKLVDGCNKVKSYQLLNRRTYSKRLCEWNGKIEKYCQVVVPLQLLRDLKEDLLQKNPPREPHPCMYTAGLIEGPILGVVFQGLFTGVRDCIKQVRKFNSERKATQNTLQLITPIIDKIEEYNKELGHHPQETKTLLDLLKEGDELVDGCEKVKSYQLLNKLTYSKSLCEWNGKIEKYCQVEIPLQLLRDLKKSQQADAKNLNIANYPCTGFNAGNPNIAYYPCTGFTPFIDEEDTNACVIA